MSDRQSFLGNADIETINSMYKEYLENPDNVEETWQKFFEGFDFAQREFPVKKSSAINDKEFKVINLIYAFRQRGHLFTKTNPVRSRRQYLPDLSLDNFGLSDLDLDSEFQAGTEIGIGRAKLREILNHLTETYCRTIGVEYMFIRNPEKVKWLQDRMESTQNRPVFTHDEKKHIYFHLQLAVGFEKFIHKKFIGQKRFSLEGAESVIPALDAVIEKGAELGIQEFVIGMSHRGRLNVLANILQKPYENIFEEFTGKQYDEENFLGDVKYHLGYENDVITDSGKKVHLNLVPNPSHLETVGGVVQGLSRSKIDFQYNKDYGKLAPIVIHGDAAVATQGVVYEIIQMSKLEGYKTGGTIHLVINNQVGFTTSYLEARSSTYSTDIAKVIKSPVFHVNGDDPEALIYTIKLAMEYRQTFHTDVFIDLLCYRKYGHNEGDEPRFTQPLLYKEIARHPNVRDIYSKYLVEQNLYTQEQVKQAEADFESVLEEKIKISVDEMDTVLVDPFLEKEWKAFRQPDEDDFFKPMETGFDKKRLMGIAHSINTLPEGRKFFSKIEKLLNARKKLFEGGKVDWAMAELLAYGSLLEEGHPVRLSGQDSIRGTFSHRHAAYVEEDTGERYFPLKNLSENQAEFNVLNSLLSEYGVMGFEYGYALAKPEALVVWEAQFGDFHNVAQVVIDQYISSAVEKWGLMNGLVLYLPHGYEGQGPEHSSARVERFLTLCANNNMQVVNPTTPANFFHLLRRQTHRDFKIPLVVFTPKSLLRHPDCISEIDELAKGHFMEVIDDDFVMPEKVKQVVLTFGKIYYELDAYRKENEVDDVAIIRIEQLYPFPYHQIMKILIKYKNVENKLWVQDEPINMGAWSYVQRVFDDVKLLPVARPAAASPAGGLLEQHNIRHQKLMEKTFKLCKCDLATKYCGMRCEIRENEKRRKLLGYI